MRAALAGLGIPHHSLLAYGAWAPVNDGGKVPDAARVEWLQGISGLPVAPDYCSAYERWKKSFRDPVDRIFELTLAGRLLVGHGNTSAVDVGLTLQHTWGVPAIPGSALKGLLAHWVEQQYGPADGSIAPWNQPDAARAPYQGVGRDGRRIKHGPGQVHRALFGAPDAEEDRVARKRSLPAGASAGLVAFHDALYVPGSAPGDRPLALDVLTVHQKEYYDGAGRTWPNDFDAPNPVQFLTVRPGVRMTFALSGPAGWTELAERLLVDALGEWGIGGKTSSGYGRFSRAAQAAAAPPHPRHARGERISVTRTSATPGKVKFLADDGFPGHFAVEAPPEVEVGAKVEVWVANVSPQGYTLTGREPKVKSDKGKKTQRRG